MGASSAPFGSRTRYSSGVSDLVAVGVVHADLDAVDEAADLALELAAQLDQLILEDAVVVITGLRRGRTAAPAERIGQADEIGSL